MNKEQNIVQEFRDAIACMDESTAGMVRLFNKIHQQMAKEERFKEFGCEWCERKDYEMKVEYDAHGRHIRTNEISYCPFCGKRIIE